MTHALETWPPLRHVTRLLFRSPLWALAGGMLCLTGLINGVYRSPNAAVIASIAEDPLSPPELGRGSFLLFSPLGPLISWALGATSTTEFTVVQGALTVLAVVTLVYLLRRWQGDTAARLFVIALFCSPLSNLLVGWIGQPDVFTVAGATFVAAGPLWACLVGGLLLGFNHFEQGIFIVGAGVVLRKADRGALIAVAGLVAGRVGLAGFHFAFDIEPGGDRSAYLRAAGVERYLIATLANLPTLIFSVLGVLWLPFMWFLSTMKRRRRLMLLSLHFAMLIPTCVTLDSTRVWALLSWPLVVYVVVQLSRHEPRRRLQLWSSVLFVAGVMVPRVIVWEGSVVVSNYRRMVEFVPLL